MELSARGHLTPDVLIGASAMWLDAENRKTSDPALEGQQIVGTADQQYRLYGEYQIPNTAWVLSAGASHTGERSLDEARNIDLDAFTLYDLGARYAMQLGDTDVELKVNLDNLTDEAYWLSSTGYHSLSQGMPRTLTLGSTLSYGVSQRCARAMMHARGSLVSGGGTEELSMLDGASVEGPQWQSKGRFGEHDAGFMHDFRAMYLNRRGLGGAHASGRLARLDAPQLHQLVAHHELEPEGRLKAFPITHAACFRTRPGP